MELVDELVITGAEAESWLIFNVTGPVTSWIGFPQKNLGLYLKIKSESQDTGNFKEVFFNEGGCNVFIKL